MIEDKFKLALGELSFQIIVLQHQLEEAKKTEKKNNDKDNSNKSS